MVKLPEDAVYSSTNFLKNNREYKDYSHIYNNDNAITLVAHIYAQNYSDNAANYDNIKHITVLPIGVKFI